MKKETQVSRRGDDEIRRKIPLTKPLKANESGAIEEMTSERDVRIEEVDSMSRLRAGSGTSVSACLSALLAFCKVVGINGSYATPSPSPSPSTAPPSPLLPSGLAAQMVNLWGLREDYAMDSKPAMPMAPMVPPLYPVSPAPPGPLLTPSPHPPTHPPAPTAAPKPKPTQPTAPCPKPAPAERQGGPKPP